MKKSTFYLIKTVFLFAMGVYISYKTDIDEAGRHASLAFLAGVMSAFSNVDYTEAKLKEKKNESNT